MRTLKLSWAGGEVSPEMVGRLDSRQYQTGAARILNYTPLPQGPVTRRPGSRWVADQYNASEMFLIPFVYSTDQALVIEMRQALFRFFTNGQQLLYATPRNMGEPAACWDLTANTATFLEEHGFSDNDAILFTVPDGEALPTGLSLGTTYYVIVVDSYTIQVSASAGPGAAVSLSGSPSGYTRAFLVSDHPAAWVGSTAYVQGDLMYWFGGGSQPDGVYYCKTDHTSHASDPYNDTANWWPLLNDGQLTVPSPYAESALPSIHYAQSNDVMTLVHPDHPPRELRRLGAKKWDLRAITFGSTLDVPTTLIVTADRGASITISTTYNGTGGRTHFESTTEHNLAKGDAVYIDVTVGNAGLTSSGYYIVDARVDENEFALKTVAGSSLSYGAGGSVIATVYYASLSAQNSQSYKVTAVDNNDIETVASAAQTGSNNLDVEGASNAITWTAVTGAQKYRVYREENGIYGYIGESETNAFTDDGIDVDAGRTPPIADTDLSGSDYPRAVGYFEQRRCFAGTTDKPRNLWMTKSGTESDMTYSLPIQDDDRISVALAAREAATVRHIVPMSDMLLLTQQGEWRVTSINSDAITPETIAVRQQSEIGASDVRPLVVNNAVVFAANRGGHVRTMAYNWQAQGYLTGDLSLRATHLFDGLTIQDSTYSKAPYPVLWFVSSSGKLLSLTYVPEEEVAGWAAHDLGEGAYVESVCSIPEGDQDSVYVVVRRTVNGTEGRYIERLVPQVTESLEDSVYLDSSVSFDGLETSGRTLTLTGGRLWTAGETVTVTASAHLFKDSSETGDELELHGTEGAKYRVRISGYTSSTVVTGVLLDAVPTAMQRTSVTSWAFARKVMSGLSHLEGESVSIVADGVVLDAQTVASGQVTLTKAAAKIHVGRNFISEVLTLPISMQQVDGAGQGRTKNISTAHLRVLESAGMKVGPDADHLVPVEGMGSTTLTTGEQRAVPSGTWTQSGEFLIRQDQPLPSTVLGLTLDVELGG